MGTITLLSNAESFYKWESDWIGWLLSDFTVENICDPKLSVVRDRVILVISGDIRGQGEAIEASITGLKRSGAKVGLFHLSDEWFVYPTNFYKEAAFVFRVHWRPDVIDGNHCQYIPLGYPNGMARRGTLKPASQRTHLWSFMGELKGSRIRMLKAAGELPNGLTHLTHKWEDESALGPDEYTGVLNDSILSLCAAGNYTPDTFRLYEALEAGAIPIVEDQGGAKAWSEALWPPSLLRMEPWKDRYWRKVARKMTRPSYWKIVYGEDFPCPTLCHWDNLKNVVDRLDIDQTSAGVTAWWEQTKRATRMSVAKAVHTHLC